MRVFDNMIYIVAVLCMALVLQLIGMAFAVIEDQYIGRRDRGILLVIAALVFSLIIQNLIDHMIGEQVPGIGDHTAFLATLTGVYGYVVRPVIIVLFTYLISPHGKKWPMWALVVINGILYMTAFFTPVVIHYDDKGNFIPGPLHYTCFIVSIILLVNLVARSVLSFNRTKVSDAVIPIFIGVVVVVATITDVCLGKNLPVSFLTVAMTSGCLFYYIWLHLRLVREYEKSLLAEQRIQIMMSQIQPHFLYNTLATIQALCSTDPQTAARTVEKFGNYLRQNLAALSETDLIPLKKELEHTRIYTEIELLMFPEIQIEYNIVDGNFRLPALSIQPLVENSIRHGVRGVRSPLITITTRKEKDEHVIVISDNGKGFDAGTEFKSGGTHIGIRNVRERLEKMCNGTLDITSSPGEGCTVTMRIPIRKEQQ